MSTGSWLEELGTPAFRDSLVARAPRLAVWVIALGLGVQAALIVTGLAGAGQVFPSRAAQLPTPQPALDVAALANAHLFGEPPPPSPADDANAPQTNMPLVLTGIIAGHTPQDGLAILGPNANSTRVYAVGQRVPGNATVHAIYEDRVLLDRGGNIEALTLPRRTGTVHGHSPALSAVNRVERALESQPGLLGDVMRPQPVFVDGHQRGYRVYPGRNARAFTSLGLRNGDLVTAINGTPLDDPNRGTDVLQTLSSSDQAHITVMRDGQQQELTLDMSQIANQAEQMATGNPDATSAGQNGRPATPAAPPARAVQ
jgi:general secretion pathway protein C